MRNTDDSVAKPLQTAAPLNYLNYDLWILTKLEYKLNTEFDLWTVSQLW